jgi:hypothetical protein
MFGKPSRDFIQSSAVEDFTLVINGVSQSYGRPNNVYVFDEKGIVIFQDPVTKNINDVEFYFSSTDYRFSPRQLYEGEFLINKSAISASQGIKEINEHISGLYFEYAYGRSFKTEIENILINIHYKDKENQIELITIVFDTEKESNSEAIGSD